MAALFDATEVYKDIHQAAVVGSGQGQWKRKDMEIGDDIDMTPSSFPETRQPNHTVEKSTRLNFT